MFDAVRRVATDRFTLFALIGLAFFFIEGRFSSAENEIIIDNRDIAMLEGRWELQTGTTPSADELDALIEFHVREEVMVREARRLGIDQGDVILRRRLVQKMELLMRDEVEDITFETNDIETFYQDNQARYSTPKQVGFRHIYLGSDRERPDETAERVRSEIDASEDPDLWRSLGQSFMLSREYAPRPQASFVELFGPEFAEALMLSSKGDSWWGPVRSSYGWHLVQTRVLESARTLPLEDVRDQVVADLRVDFINRQQSEKLNQMISRYDVVEDWRTP
ncbi:MAG: peptidylprolyl isomerase [Pseudomonadota bacterium]